mgnify:CR=1 FL=1
MFIDSSSTLNVVGKAGLNQIKNSDAGKQLLGRMYIPGIVMQAFAAELYFKALVVHEGKQIEKIQREYVENRINSDDRKDDDDAR